MTLRLRIVLGLLLLALLGVLWWILPVQDLIDRFRLWILGLGVLGLIAFAVSYVVLTLSFGPASALSLTAGLAYGAWGFPLVVVSATLAGSVAFLLGRTLARERVARMVQSNPRLAALNQAVSEGGWRVVGLMRLSPIIPYGIQNYLFSVTDVKFVPYVLATLFGIMPSTALYVYIGSLGQAAGEGGPLKWIFVAVGLLATALVAWLITRRAQAALASHIHE